MKKSTVILQTLRDEAVEDFNTKGDREAVLTNSSEVYHFYWGAAIMARNTKLISYEEFYKFFDFLKNLCREDAYERNFWGKMKKKKGYWRWR